MDERHHLGVRELDLRDCSPNYMADTVVPGLRTSAAFFTFLRANLVLTPSAMSSAANTPNLEPWSSQTLPLPSPSPLASNPPLVPLDDIPPLSLEPLQEHDDKVEGLRLVADSVAQMQTRAASTLISHPLCLLALAAAWGAIYRYSYVPTGEVGRAVMLCSGVTMTYLMAIRYATGGYISLAEKMHWSWITADSGDEDMILGARYGETIIGALVLRLEPKPQTSPTKKKSRNACMKGGKGVIRAWTTLLKYRGKGIGKDLLHEAVRATKERCGKDAEVGFAKEHANSVMVLPNVFNGPFRRGEIRAAKALQGVLAEWEVSKKKKR